MQGAITVDAEQRFLRFTFEQGATIRDWVEAQGTFLRLSQETGIRRALVDVRKQRLAGEIFELFDFAEKIPSGAVFAVLGDARSEDQKFVETVALNRGKNVCLFFGPEEEAIEWLMTGAR